MRSFEQARKFVGRNHGNSLATLSANHDDLAVIHDAIHHRSKMFPQTGVSGFDHDLIVQQTCT
jgi:hypothetical protein